MLTRRGAAVSFRALNSKAKGSGRSGLGCQFERDARYAAKCIVKLIGGPKPTVLILSASVLADQCPVC
jgi:hypothetical protein